MRAEMELARRRLALLEKLQRAAVARKEGVEARLAAMPQVSCPFSCCIFCKVKEVKCVRPAVALKEGVEGAPCSHATGFVCSSLLAAFWLLKQGSCVRTAI